MRFLAVDRIYPENSFSENGVLGLAPTSDVLSIVKNLHEQNKINNQIISINYEDGNHSISFGDIDYSKLSGGQNSLNYFSNVGQDSWAVSIDNLVYNGSSISTDIDGFDQYVHLKIAHIDSGNGSI